METVATIEPGEGYWDCTNYPIGGCFRRVPSDGPALRVSNLQPIVPAQHGCSHIGTTDDGRRVAF